MSAFEPPPSSEPSSGSARHYEPAFVPGQPLDFPVLARLGRGEKSPGQLTFRDSVLAFQPADGATESLWVSVGEIESAKRFVSKVTVQTVHGQRWTFRAPLRGAYRPEGGGVTQRPPHPSEAAITELPKRLHASGVLVRQSAWGPLDYDPPRPNAIRRRLAPFEMLFVFTFVTLMVAALVFIPIALIGNLAGLNSDQFPRSWIELGIELVLLAFAASYVLFALRYRPEIEHWQYRMATVPLFGYIAVMAYVIAT